jgi:hypothetical protein
MRVIDRGIDYRGLALGTGCDGNTEIGPAGPSPMVYLHIYSSLQDKIEQR